MILYKVEYEILNIIIPQNLIQIDPMLTARADAFGLRRILELESEDQRRSPDVKAELPRSHLRCLNMTQ